MSEQPQARTPRVFHRSSSTSKTKATVMRLHSCTIAGVATLLLCLIVPIQSRKLHHNKESKHGHVERNQESKEGSERNSDLYNLLAKYDEQDECHKAALHKCGQTFLRAHKLLSYLDDSMVAYRTKCGVRTAFFDCLKTTREKFCSKRYKHYVNYEPDFRKRLTDALWSSRICVLGIKSYR
ncbi:uncharacterized protein LOC118182167 isoform X2 [Stegodyphus dumicola]|uniref:uncharacterized protein LOC118182167 isoform X2 n=1 Tax=Stegodyphus dumicola TaxID=202533 RepID=UPI0015AA34F9|nr:uncharacterized protein LOC118182167 isoform X2 [Stegodyphus dumicola]